MGRSQRSGRPHTLVAALALVAAASLALAPSATAASAGVTSVGPATAAAVAAVGAGGLRAAVAVTDTTTGVATIAGEADALFPSESVVKVLIAARLLVDGRMTGAVGTEAAAMISASDDDAADGLWGLVGGPDVVAWAADRYDLAGLGAPSEWGWWGNTKVSATGLAALYTALLADPAVAPWLVAQLSAMTPVGADGTDQSFGFAASTTVAGTALNQGWGGDDDAGSTANLLSTGYLGDTQFAVAVIVQDPAGGSTTSLVPAIDAVADAVVTDIGADVGAQPTAGGTASDVVVAPTTAGSTTPVGGASGPLADGPWWPASLGVLGAAGLLGLAVARLNAWQQRRAAVRRS